MAIEIVGAVLAVRPLVVSLMVGPVVGAALVTISPLTPLRLPTQLVAVRRTRCLLRPLALRTALTCRFGPTFVLVCRPWMACMAPNSRANRRLRRLLTRSELVVGQGRMVKKLFLIRARARYILLATRGTKGRSSPRTLLSMKVRARRVARPSAFLARKWGPISLTH